MILSWLLEVKSGPSGFFGDIDELRNCNEVLGGVKGSTW